jgi:hypothetical protein
MSDRRRMLAFASAAVVLLGITAVSTLREAGPPARRDARPHQPAGTSAIRTVPLPASELGQDGDAGEATPRPSPAPSTNSSSTASTQGEREAKSPPAVAPRKARAATAAARAFLAGYLPYSYGRSDADRIRAAARRLLRELEASLPRVPATVARARPRLISVRAQAATGDLDIDVLAVVDDGQRRYSIPLAVRHAGRRWIVTAISG